MLWTQIICVAMGAALGGILRFLFSLWFTLPNHKFPWPTLLVNLIGSFLLGLIYAYYSKPDESMLIRLFLATGFCGGFTTFSTFSMELLTLLQNGQYFTGMIYLLTSLIGGLGLAWVGYRLLN